MKARFAALEKCAQAFLAFGTDALVGDRARRDRARVVVGRREQRAGSAVWQRSPRSGPALRISPMHLSTAASRASAGTTSCTKPMRSARAASKRSPVRKSARACDAPIFASTNGEITAGMMPSLTSVKPKIASSAAIATSQTAARPAPPPSAAP